MTTLLKLHIYKQHDQEMGCGAVSCCRQKQAEQSVTSVLEVLEHSNFFQFFSKIQAVQVWFLIHNDCSGFWLAHFPLVGLQQMYQRVNLPTGNYAKVDAYCFLCLYLYRHVVTVIGNLKKHWHFLSWVLPHVSSHFSGTTQGFKETFKKNQQWFTCSLEVILFSYIQVTVVFMHFVLA